jgi:hypothetical protein
MKDADGHRIRAPQLSPLIAKMWRQLPHEEKALWEEKAKQVKDEHAHKYPDYTFKPISREERKRMQEEDMKKIEERKEVKESEKSKINEEMIRKTIRRRTRKETNRRGATEKDGGRDSSICQRYPTISSPVPVETAPSHTQSLSNFSTADSQVSIQTDSAGLSAERDTSMSIVSLRSPVY